MLSITLHQMRTGWVRLLAAGIAIMLGTGFVAATMLGGQTMQSAAYQSFTSDYRGADLVIEADQVDPGEFTPDVIERLAADPAITRVQNKAKLDALVAAEAAGSSGQVNAGEISAGEISAGEISAGEISAGEISAGDDAEWALLGAVTPEAQEKLAEGHLPTADDELALRSDIANRLEVGVGDVVPVSILAASSEGEPAGLTLTISGLLTPAADFFSYTPDGLITEAALASGVLAQAATGGPLAITLADPDQLESAVAQLQESLGEEYRVTTVTDLAEATMAQLTGDTNTMRNLLLGFAGVALAVAALVISNTFSVLVAQRTRHLALLRTVGASRSQVRRSVLLEAGLLGLIASLAGVGLGFGVIAAAVGLLSSSVPGIDLWRGLTLTPGVWLTTIVTGVIVTLIAGWMPAHAATKVRPLQALRPEPVTVGTTAGKFRAAFSLLAVLSGAGLLAAGVALGSNPEQNYALLGLALGIMGGFVSVFGVLLGAVFVITPIVRLVGHAFGRGVPAQVATMGAVRNPRRTAATTNALFIGVGLVAMMTTGAATAKVSLDQELAESFPIDMEIASVEMDRAISDEQVAAIRALPETGAVAGVTHVIVPLQGPDPEHVEVLAPDEAAVFDDPAPFTELKAGQVLVPERQVDTLAPGETFTVTAASGEGVELTVAGVEDIAGTIITTPATLALLEADPARAALWVQLDEEADPVAALAAVEEAISSASGPALSVYANAAQRDSFAQVIDTLLLIVTAMLAVAVVIALVGVANTLSLSVIERRRESATLRALGLTRGQLRGMLAIEGVLIAVVGALTGVVGGLVYGWAGVMTLLGAMGQVHLAFPWATIVVILAVAAAAGLVASVLPARSAVRVSPVAALAED